MEDSPPLHRLVLNTPETACSFPPRRRRPLPSRTCGALLQIISLHRPQLRVKEPVCEEDGSITHGQVISTEMLVPLPNSKGSEDKVAQETSDGEGKENNGVRDFDGKHETGSKLHQPELVRDSEKQLTPPNEISVEDYMIVEEKADDCAARNAKELENVNSILDIEMDDIGTLKNVELGKDSCFDQFSDVFDSCFGSDVAVESSESRLLSQEKGSVSEVNLVKNMDYELQMKEMELEKLIFSSGNTEGSLCQNAGRIEEGEISGDAGNADASFDASLRGVTLENSPATKGYFDRDKLLCEDTDRGCQQHGMSNPQIANVANIASNPKDEKNRLPARQLRDYHDLDVLRPSHMKTPKRRDTPCGFDNKTPPGRILPENAAENQTSITTEMDENAGKNKRKRIVTEERKAKKKKKERIKRAEKNRELGVERLKLPMIMKPKQKGYCRHYLRGRCNEGKDCKFSHDTVPLTKFQPCGHFARHTCMKGDDCPYDHQLSKYPCTNYTNGFCNRGSECMFSHKIPAKSSSETPSASNHGLISQPQTLPGKEGSHPVLKAGKSELKSPSTPNNQNSTRPMDSFNASDQKVNSRLGSATNSAQRAQLALKPVPRTGRPTPRGVSLLNAAVPLDDNGKEKRDGSSVKTIDGSVAVSCKGALEVAGPKSELNPSKPRGINFLSFSQPPSDESSSKFLSSLLPTSNDGTEKPVMYDIGKGNFTCLSDEGAGTLNVRRLNQRDTNLVSDVKANETPPTVPRIANFLSFNRARLDASTSKEKGILDSSKSDTAMASVKKRQSTSELQDITGTPSPFSRGQGANYLKAFQSTLAIAAQLEPDVKAGLPHHQRII
ncbi:uncharacterized protein LOC121796271 isoform X1 [Salvia splendens]|uniref:uncharacterized protein LOC121796271 isoform X1 n=1 Tax=Salvia splendens TaxID=180675 RepID=UPI001C2775CC|nr:uncharacterized protein LOC121796271 isoform X1 [Salvia splendens]XP_042051012.1 uncharacterized protein LOC121796271 isoform X1 [Salvia splendens]